MNATIGRNLTRRQLIGGIGAAGLATAVGGKLAFAQETTTSTTDTTTAATTLTDLLTRVDAAIAEAQADRAAVTSIDFTIVDQLIDEALNLRDQAAAATEQTEQFRFAIAAIRSANSSGAVIEALLTTFGLPSKQTRSSVVLAEVHEGLTTLATEVGTANADAVTFVDIAQALYTEAYDAYNAGTYASATRLAMTAGRVGSIAMVLTATDLDRAGFGDRKKDRDMLGGRGDRIRDRVLDGLGDGPDRDRDRLFDGSGDGPFGGDIPAAPVEVPVPAF